MPDFRTVNVVVTVCRNKKYIFCVSIELQKQKWKFGRRMKNAVGTQAILYASVSTAFPSALKCSRVFL